MAFSLITPQNLSSALSSAQEMWFCLHQHYCNFFLSLAYVSRYRIMILTHAFDIFWSLSVSLPTPCIYPFPSPKSASRGSQCPQPKMRDWLSLRNIFVSKLNNCIHTDVKSGKLYSQETDCKTNGIHLLLCSQQNAKEKCNLLCLINSLIWLKITFDLISEGHWHSLVNGSKCVVSKFQEGKNVSYA